MANTALVLGGGVGGLVAANRLRRWLPRGDRVVLVEREASIVFQPSLLWVMSGARSATSIARPMARLERKGIEVVRGEVDAIDAARREVSVSGRKLSADHVVVALGADLVPEAVPGLAAGGHNFYSLAGAKTLNAALGGFGGGRVVLLTAAPAYKCPAAPYEASMLIEAFCRKRKIRGGTRIDLYAAEPGPMGVAGLEVSKAVRSMVEAKGISYHPEHQVTKVDAMAKRVTFANGVEAEFDLLAYVPAHRAPRVVRDAGLAPEGGYVAVDRATLATKFERVYAIGDVVGIPLKLGKPLPKAGVFAHAEAEVVARNIARDASGRGSAATFDGNGSCLIETGDGRAGMGKGNFYAEPLPEVRMHRPRRIWHLAKVAFEQYWLRRWF